jgi:hypothetical protein
VSKGFFFSGGSRISRFSYIHVKDLTRGLTLAAEKPNSIGRRYFMCSPNPTNYDEICSLTATTLKKRAMRIVVPPFLLALRRGLRELRQAKGEKTIKAISDAMRRSNLHWICNGSKAESELGFRTDINLTEGITETANWYLQHGWIWVRLKISRAAAHVEKVHLMRERGSFFKSPHLVVLIIAVALGVDRPQRPGQPCWTASFLHPLGGLLFFSAGISVSSLGRTGSKAAGLGVLLLTPIHQFSILVGILKGVMTNPKPPSNH